jgi:hypothetical protein
MKTKKKATKTKKIAKPNKAAQAQIALDQVTFWGSLIKLGAGQRKP